jgi:hypothetical protein
MKNQRGEKSDGFDHRLGEWSGTEPRIGDVQFRKALLDRLPDRRPRFPVPVALAVVAAFFLVVLLFEFEYTRQPVGPHFVEAPEVVYETGDNVILVLRDDGPPIYVVKDVLETGGEVR